MRAVVPRPNKTPRCVQKRPRISHAKLKPPRFSPSRPSSARPPPNPLADHPCVRVDGPRKRSHLNANNALIARATRVRSHTIEASGSPPSPTRRTHLPSPSFALSFRPPSAYPLARSPFSARYHDPAFLPTCSYGTLRSPLFTTLPHLPRYDLCPRAQRRSAT